MEPGSGILHSKQPSNDPYTESNLSIFFTFDAYFFRINSSTFLPFIRLGHPRGIFSVWPLKFWNNSHPLLFWLHALSISIFHSPFSSLLGTNIRLRILFSNTLSLDSYLNVRGHVAQPYSKTGNIIVLCILIFKFWEGEREWEI